MAVQYIELGEDPNIKALRETILGVSSSIAGGIAMRRKQQNDLAMQAMKAAHQNYLTQVGIESREKIASEGHRLQQESLDLQEARFQHEKDLLADEVNAAEGFDFWMDSSLNFELDANGKLKQKGDAEQLRNAIKKINLHSGTRTKYTQAKLAIGEQQRTIGARVLAVKSAFEADSVRTSPFLQSVLENGKINYSQLSKLARSDTWYKEVVDAGLVPAVTTGQKWQDENFQTYLNASTDFLKPDGTSWLAGSYSSGNIRQRSAVTSYNRAVKNIETEAKFDKTRPEITDTLSQLDEGVDPFDDGRKNLIAQLVNSHAKSTMQSSGFIPANTKQVRHYINQQIGTLADKLEVKLKNDGDSGNSKEENYSQLFQDEYKKELEQYGIKVLEKPKANYVEIGMYYLSKAMQGDVADERGVLPSQKLHAHIMSNMKNLPGKHVNEILDPGNKEAKIIGNNFRTGKITVGNFYNQPKKPEIEKISGKEKDGVIGIDSDQMLNNVHRNWQGINNLPNDFYSAAETINKDLPYQLQLNSDSLKKVQEWYQSIEDKNPGSIGFLRNDNFYNLEGEGGINIAVRRLMATKEGRSKLAKLYDNPKSDDQLIAVEKFHAGYVNNMMLQDPFVGPVLRRARKMTGVSDVTAEDLEARVNNKNTPASQRERIAFFPLALGGNKRAWELLAQIFLSNHGMGQ